MTITTSPTDTAAAARARTITSIEVSAAPGSVRVGHAASSAENAPRIRPIVLSTDADHARISLVPEGALLLAGDNVHLQVTVRSGVRLELVEPAGTVAYDMHGGSARWHVEVAVEDQAALVWHAEPFVLSQGAHVVRTLSAVLYPEGALAVRETLALGRHGERAGELHQSARIERPDGTPLLVDGFQVTHGRPGLGLGDKRVIESVTLLGRALTETPATGTVLELDRGGMLWRALADEAHRAEEVAVWHDAVREALS